MLGLTNSNRAPRYFHAIFLAFWQSLVRDRKRVRDPEDALERLGGRGDALAIPSGGGDWRKDAKRRSVDKVKQYLRNTLEVNLNGMVWAKQGSMVAYRGGVRFEREGMM